MKKAYNQNSIEKVNKEKFSFAYNSFNSKEEINKFLRNNKKLEILEDNKEKIIDFILKRWKDLRNYYSHYKHLEVIFEKEEKKLLEKTFSEILKKVRQKEQENQEKKECKYSLFHKDGTLTKRGNVFFLSFFVTKDYLSYFVPKEKYLKEALIYFSLRPSQSNIASYNENFLKVISFFDNEEIFKRREN